MKSKVRKKCFFTGSNVTVEQSHYAAILPRTLNALEVGFLLAVIGCIFEL